MIYNASVVFEMAAALASRMVLWRLTLLVIALISAVATGLLDTKRRKLGWRTPQRIVLHLFMHLSGGIGTFLLLVATVRMDKLTSKQIS